MTTLTSELRNQIRADVSNALLEDVGSGDLTAGLVPATSQAKAVVIVRQAAVLCGQAWFEEVFQQLDANIAIHWHVSEGAQVAENDLLCEITGPARPVLTGERSALNFLQTLSGTATAARAYSDALRGTSTAVLDTRKTLPGLRCAQKYAVTVGGGQNHRIGLYDGILIKENHIVAAGTVKAAVEAALAAANGVLIEVEVESIDEARAAMEAGAQRLLLDNLNLAEMAAIAALRDADYETISLEASGGITLELMRDIANCGVDFISVGDITKNVNAVDFSMRFELE